MRNLVFLPLAAAALTIYKNASLELATLEAFYDAFFCSARPPKAF